MQAHTTVNSPNLQQVGVDVCKFSFQEIRGHPEFLNIGSKGPLKIDANKKEHGGFKAMSLSIFE